MLMTSNTQPNTTTPPKRAVVVRKDGTFMTFDETIGKFYGVGLFTIFPSKAAASRAVNRMCVEHDPDFWKMHDVEEYEE